MPSLVTTKRGRAWLANFDEKDRSTARRLLDGVEMVSDGQFRGEMKDLLARARGETTGSTVAAYAVHNLPKNFAPHYFGCKGPHALITPLRCPTTVHSGSEMIVQNILIKTAHALNISVDQTVEEMYESRVDRVLLVTDNVASGQEINTFLDFMRANPRLRSWQSFGWLKFEIVTHSISESALASLKRHTVVHYEQLSRAFETTDWSVDQLAEVRALCVTYGSIKREKLGRQNAESLQLFGHTFGNGTPAILRQRVGQNGSAWSPLLPHDRDYALGASEIAALHGYRAPHSLLAALRRLRQKHPTLLTRVGRVALKSRNRPSTGPRGVDILALLSIIDTGYTRSVDLMKAGSMSVTRLHAVARAAFDLELIEGYESLAQAIGLRAAPVEELSATPLPDVQLTLTDHGRQLLRRRGRSKPLKPRDATREAADQELLTFRVAEAANADPPLASEPPPYYPQQLR